MKSMYPKNLYKTLPRADRMSALLAVLEQVVDTNGNISLLIIKEMEEVEEHGIVPKTLSDNGGDLKEWMEVSLDEVPLEAKVEDIENPVEAKIDGMESPVEAEVKETKSPSVLAQKLKDESDSKDLEEMELKIEAMVQDRFQPQTDRLSVEKPQNKDIHAQTKADTKASLAELATIWSQKHRHVESVEVNNGASLKNEPEPNHPYVFKNDLHGMARKDYARDQSMELDNFISYQNPGEVLNFSAQLKEMHENTVMIWQQLTKWVSGMALCKICEKAFPTGNTKHLLRHMEAKHKEDLTALRMDQFNGNYKKGTIMEFKAESVPESRKKCNKSAILKIFTNQDSGALLCNFCDQTHKKHDTLSVLKHIKGNHKEEFMNFEKEFVIDQYLLYSLPTYEELDSENVCTIKNRPFEPVNNTIKKRYKPKEGLECKCGETFTSHLQLDAHIKRVHMRENLIVCSVCGFEVNGKREERTHMTRVHKPTHHPCLAEDCKRVFKHKKSATDHFDHIHLGIPTEKNYSCDDCGKAFVGITLLNHHISADHLLLRPFVCKECGKSFKRRKDVWHHKEVHSTTNRYICPSCDRGFRNHGALWNHKKLHQ